MSEQVRGTFRARYVGDSKNTVEATVGYKSGRVYTLNVMAGHPSWPVIINRAATWRRRAGGALVPYQSWEHFWHFWEVVE
jgi:hypothetical protein